MMTSLGGLQVVAQDCQWVRVCWEKGTPDKERQIANEEGEINSDTKLLKYEASF